jgi:hypothetical protein
LRVNPKVHDVLGALAGHLFTEVLPLLSASYAQADTMMTALLLTGAAEEFGRAAEVRSSDIREMRELFAEAARRLPPGALRDRVAAASDREAQSLLIADLDACRDDLAGALIALHEAVETSREPWARELDAKIWQHLRASTQRRAMTTSPF